VDITGGPRIVGGTVDIGPYEYSNVVNNTNLLSNSGFEAEQYATQTPSGWSEWSSWGGNGGSFTEYSGAKSGNYHATHHSNSGYNIYTSQTKTGLTNGLYTARAWVKSNGGFTVCYLEAKDFGGNARTANIAGNWNWNQVTIQDINVTNGKCTIGIWSNSSNGGTMYFDDVEFFKQ
jgi:arabinogalactan endo-1,4-beta-galactosidase